MNEQLQEKDKLAIGDYIEERSKLLIREAELNEELSRIAEARKGMLGYYDSKEVKFSVEGYDFVYFDEDLNLKHVKIEPDQISVFKDAAKVGEGDELEKKLEEAGFILDQSEKFRSALYRQLNDQI